MYFFHFDAADITFRDDGMTGVCTYCERCNEKDLKTDLGLLLILGQGLGSSIRWVYERMVTLHSLYTNSAGHVRHIGVRSLVNLGTGIADLILLPIKGYNLFASGLQKGALFFAKAATLETIKLGTQLAVGT